MYAEFSDAMLYNIYRDLYPCNMIEFGEQENFVKA